MQLIEACAVLYFKEKDKVQRRSFVFHLDETQTHEQVLKRACSESGIDQWVKSNGVANYTIKIIIKHWVFYYTRYEND